NRQKLNARRDAGCVARQRSCETFALLQRPEPGFDVIADCHRIAQRDTRSALVLRQRHCLPTKGIHRRASITKEQEVNSNYRLDSASDPIQSVRMDRNRHEM
ncbi:hypothetical protein SB394_34520, partial [Burkholderia sp. BCCIQ04A]|uniref:hypothetical protein n=1 Tax=Burkholderia anthinoferrum TaxID=3090833 RepID=UPI002B242C64